MPIIGLVYDQSTPKLVRGSDAFIVTQLVYESDNPGDHGAPYAFQSAVGSTAYFPSDPTINVLAPPIVSIGTILSSELGLVRFPVPASASTGLQLGDELCWEQVLQDALGTTIIVFHDLGVIKPVF
jgi:hypothetical protein